jgi:hypothetical protein
MEISDHVANPQSNQAPSPTLHSLGSLTTADAPILVRPPSKSVDAPQTTDYSRPSCDGALSGDQTTSSSVAKGELIDFDPEQLVVNVPAAPTPSDAYDPALLGLSQDFVGESNVKKLWSIVKVEKPSKARVFRVHPDPKFRLKTTLLTLKEENETYLVLPELRGALVGESTCGVNTLLACVTKQGTPFLWPIRMADPDGRWNIWHKSAWDIAGKATTRWTRMQSNRDAGYYIAEYDKRPLDQQQAPAWPEMTFKEWLRLAFQGFTIDRRDHPVLKRLRLED